MKKSNVKKNTVYVVGVRGIPDTEGGAEKNAEMVFPYIVDLGYDVTLFGLSQHIQQPDFKGVKLKAAPNWLAFKTDKLALYAYVLWQALIKRPDIVHVQTLGAAILVLAFKLMGLRVVARYGSTDYLYNKWGFLGNMACKFGEWQLRFADSVIAVSPSMQKHLAKRGIKKNVTMIFNGVDEKSAAELSDKNLPEELKNEPFILTVGRITTPKNLETLITAFHKNNAGRDHPLKLVIAGGIDEQDYYDSLVALGTENVLFLGRVSRETIYSLLGACKIFINCSQFEGLSNAVLEAIAANNPVLLSDIPPNRDVQLPDHHYFTYDDVTTLTDRIADVLDQAEKFKPGKGKLPGWYDVAQQTVDIYATLQPQANNQLERTGSI